MTTDTFTRQFFRCPHCGKGEQSAEHLSPGTSFGPWYCDLCGGSFVGRIDFEGRIELELRAERKIATFNVLVLKPQAKPVYFVVEGMRFEGGSLAVDDQHESSRYFYEEHSCPTNWLQPVMVFHDGDADPHGLLEFVKGVDATTLPPDQSWGPNDRDAEMVDLIQQSAEEPPR